MIDNSNYTVTLVGVSARGKSSVELFNFSITFCILNVSGAIAALNCAMSRLEDRLGGLEEFTLTNIKIVRDGDEI